jgi:diguanylate cyclase (GGDEF)-like protein
MPEIDKLTGFATQKFFLQELEQEVLRVKRYKKDLSLLLAQPNYEFFKNDSYVKTSLHYSFLKQLGAIFRKVLRDIDLVARYEGEQILALLPETGEEGAKLAAGRLLKEVENHRFKGDDKVPEFQMGLDIGISTFLKHAKTAHEMILVAQKGLQIAIQEGGNKFSVSPIVLEETSS